MYGAVENRDVNTNQADTRGKQGTEGGIGEQERLEGRGRPERRQDKEKKVTRNLG